MLAFLVIVLALAVYTQLRASTINGIHPRLGDTARVDGHDIHYVDRSGGDAGSPVLVFVHGASGNLRDPMLALRDRFEGRYRLVFFDRPGHGWSSRQGRIDSAPAVQAELLAGLLDARGIDRAVIVGHSWGGSLAAAFALRHPDRTAGIVFVAPVSHPWGGGVNWYYRIAALPVIGWLFVNILTMPAGLLSRDRVLKCVFSPAEPPDDYADAAGIDLVLRPQTFRANAEDVVCLHRMVAEMAPRYPTITAPVAIVSDMKDPVVYTHIHSTGLALDIENAELVLVDGAGHMPHHSRTDVVVAAVENVIERGRQGVGGLSISAE